MNRILAIAIDEYDDVKINNLKNCLNDINSLIGVFSQRYEFDLIELFTKSEQTTRAFLFDVLYSILVNSIPDDNILIIYAGHGEYNSILETSYWLCSDSRKDNISTWFNVSDLMGFFKGAKAKHIALISDSCFSGAIFETDRGGGIAALKNKISRQALTSGGLEKVSDGAENSNSPFNLSIQKVLSENIEKYLSFTEFSEKVIRDFNSERAQTPSYGSLIGSGHKGGTLFFHLKSEKQSLFCRAVQIPLEIDAQVNVDYEFEIPFFNDSSNFSSQFINAFIQQLGYSIINDIRNFVTEDREYLISLSSEVRFYLQVNYSIETFNKDFLSIIINRSDFFGGVHPNHYIYTLNFSFNPDRLVQLFDVITYHGYSNSEEYLKELIRKYADAETKQYLLEYTTYEYIHKLDFSFNNEYLTIYYFNLLPHVFKSAGIVEIPIAEISLKMLK